MKSPCLFLLCILSITSAQAAINWVQVPGELPYAEHLPAVKIPLITLLDGREFRDCSVIKETWASISFRHAKGMTKVDKRLLPPEVLKIFPLDTETAKMEDEVNASGKKVYDAMKKLGALQIETEQRARQARIAAEKDRGRPVARADRAASNGEMESETVAAPNKEITVFQFAVRPIQFSEEYAYYAWTASIANRTNSPQKVRTWLRIYDANKFLLEEAMGDEEAIPTGQTVIVSSKSLMKASLWKQALSYSCVIKE